MRTKPMKRLPILLLLFGLLPCTISVAEDRTVVIPVEFDNLKLSCSREEIQEMVDSAAAYLGRQLCGKREIHFDLAENVTLSRTYEYYGANSTDRKDARSPEAVVEACHKLDAEYDFSSTDNVVLITAGQSEAYGGGADHFWPTQSKLSDFNILLTLDGRKIDSFGICTELGYGGLISGHGDFCHEYGHFLGLVDLYDTDGSGSGGISRIELDTLSLMASGNRNGNGYKPAPFSAVDYYQLEDFQGIGLKKGEFTLTPIETNGIFATLKSVTSGKCWLLENRRGTLLITALDRSRSFAGFSDRMKRNLTAVERWQLNEVNCNPSFQCADLVWQGTEGTFAGDSLAINGIRKDNESFVFNIFEPVVINDITTYQDCISVNWKSELDPKDIEKAGIGWWTGEEELADKEANKLPDDSFHITIENLTPGKNYNLSIHISTYDGRSFSRTISASTHSRREDATPFIMIEGSDRNEDGSFRPGARLPLRLRNGAGVAEVIWTFNGERVQTGPDGMWTIQSSGKLKAIITMLDGSEEIIVKQINVK